MACSCEAVEDILSGGFVGASHFGMVCEDESQPCDRSSGVVLDCGYIGAEDGQYCLGGLWAEQPSKAFENGNQAGGEP